MPVEFIHRQGVTDVCEVYPNLVGSAGVDHHFEQGKFLEPLHHLPVSKGRFPATYDRHFTGHAGTFANGRIDAAFVFAHDPVHQSIVHLADRSFLELQTQIAVGLGVAGIADRTRGFAVQAVHHEDLAVVAFEQMPQVRSVGALPVGYAQHSGGLVEQEQVCILVEDFRFILHDGRR